jgi:hypothetical protein
MCAQSDFHAVEVSRSVVRQIDSDSHVALNLIEVREGD